MFSFFHVQSGCNNGALRVRTWDPWQAAARNLRHHVPKNMKGLEPRPTEKPLACVVGVQAVA